MAKGPIVTPEVEAFIASVYQKHPKWTAKEVHNEVSSILHKQDSKLPPGWPGLSTVQKVLATVRKNMKEAPLDPCDKSWSTASMANYPIPAEALPSILELWVWTRENLNSDLTIRQAQWAARFYTVTKDIPTLSALARGHTYSEMIFERIGEPFDSSHHIDLWIFSHMTGQTFTLERQKKILGLSDKMWLALDEQEKKYNALRGLTLDEVEEKLLRDMEQTGGKNEG